MRRLRRTVGWPTSVPRLRARVAELEARLRAADEQAARAVTVCERLADERDQAVAGCLGTARHRDRIAAERDHWAAEFDRVGAERDAIREYYRAAPADVARLSEAELVASLRAAGVPADAGDRVTLHVGFGHAATTSLQHAFFAGRDDVFYAGLPYGDAGGFFSHLKYTDDHLLDPAAMLGWCRDTVYAHPARRGRPVVVSDEMFTEPAELYYHPHVLPGAQVAARLKRYFPAARVVFTVRRQPEYVESMYFNLKRNHAYFAGMPVPPFDEWWDGVMHRQVRGPFLINLDYAPLVRVYADLFGREKVLVLPLEELKARGPAAYLGRLCDFMGVPLRPADLDRFARPRNERMTVVEARVADLLAARTAAAEVRLAMENDHLAAVAAAAPRATLRLGDDVRAEIDRRTAAGNRWLADTFALPLGEWGYALAPAAGAACGRAA